MSNDYKNPIRRRNRIDMLCPAELAIRSSMELVELLGCSEKLTNALNKLKEAKDLVADYISEYP